ncbi:MAG: cation:proton antiporter [Kiritimatiellaeota bacterium]|nr:cation:proton antiporter [Kiritimatiellota bacterium]
MSFFSNPSLFLLVLGALLVVSVMANRASDRMGIPIMLMFLGIGMAAGSDGLGLQFTSKELANFIGIFALSLILFSGGLDTHWKSIRPVLWRALGLATFGVALTAVFLALFVWWAFPGTPFLHALLLSSIVSSTDAAAVFAIMRSRGVSLKGHIRPLLELESGSNDPMALFLTTAVLALIGGLPTGGGAVCLKINPAMFAKTGIRGACGGGGG